MKNKKCPNCGKVIIRNGFVKLKDMVNHDKKWWIVCAGCGTKTLHEKLNEVHEGKNEHTGTL